jgi:hypothetical protein
VTSKPLVPTAEDEADQKVIDDVKNHGWHVVYVLSEDTSPAWSFSIGMNRTLHHPEIVVFGLNREVMHWIINEVGRRVRHGERAEPGAVWPGLLEGYDCTFKSVRLQWYKPLLGWARWFYGGDSFSALQCIWSDKSHHWPWEDEFNPHWIWAQPLLYEEEPQAARLQATLGFLEHGPS